MRFINRLLLSCILLTAVGSVSAMQSGVADAGISGGIEAPAVTRAAAHQSGGMTLSQAVEQVRRKYNGRIVSAETKVSGGRETHIIKVLTDDGKVKTVRVPGRRV